MTKSVSEAAVGGITQGVVVLDRKSGRVIAGANPGEQFAADLLTDGVIADPGTLAQFATDDHCLRR